MSQVTVLTDSTSCIPENLLRGLPVVVIPLHLIFGKDHYMDGDNLSPEAFYHRLRTSKEDASTSQPTPAAFHDLYNRILETGNDILVLTISSKLSGTYDSAHQAKLMLPDKNIELVDTLSSGMALGFASLIAARAAAQGATLQECKTLAEKAVSMSGVILTVDTLHYLHKGGRIGGATAFLGTALDLKPIMMVKSGRIEPVERVRTKGKALDRLVDHFVEMVGKHRPIRVASLHADAAEEADLIMEKIRSRFPLADISEAFSAAVSPVIGTHTGPGTIGVAWVAGI